MSHDRISAHITYAEATKSQTAERLGIDNTPNAAQLVAMQRVAEMCFEPLRAQFGVPIGITSFFRCPALNTAIGGSSKSQHRFGEAIDLDADVFGGLTNKDAFDWLRANVVFDQLIWEFGTDESPAWVHVSYSGPEGRKQVLRAVRTPETGTQYLPWHDPSPLPPAA
jgi:hypothetical protein